jgi:hypothetical protein
LGKTKAGCRIAGPKLCCFLNAESSSQPLWLERMLLPSLMFDFLLTMSNAFNYSFPIFNVDK